ncbi:hypothetical protein [Cryobacterium sp. M23]|uniref:hypothetical protein n=1 Tax=Cryobacterium sp. M23 TaxID=2048292 RepID=UPI000CE5498B|nr:hypothetical protein [Cryobacterium sp. M23]
MFTALRPRFLIIAAALALLLTVTVDWTVVSAHASTDLRIATAAYSSAVSEYTAQRGAAAAEVAVAREDLSVAQAALDNSDGKVLDQAARDALAAALAEAGPRVDAAAAELDRADTALTKILSGHRDSTQGFTAATRALSQQKMGGVSVDVTVQRQAVTTAVLAWQVQARTAAAATADAVASAEAARQAATVAEAARAAAPRTTTGTAQPGKSQPGAAPADVPAAALPGAASQPSRPTKTPPPPVTPQTEWDVWTSGGQTEIDACKGPVDLTPVYGLPVIGEHWFCGGSEFPTKEGTVITLTGTQAGRWSIGGVAATLNKQTQDTRAIPRGYELMYQTCRNGSNTTMTFTLLTRVE